MSNLVVVNGAAMQCSNGTRSSQLIVPCVDRGPGYNWATVIHSQGMENISPFGLCTSPDNPLVAKAGEPVPCIPFISRLWNPASEKVKLRGFSIVTEVSTCACKHNGQIRVTDPGQHSIRVE